MLQSDFERDAKLNRPLYCEFRLKLHDWQKTLHNLGLSLSGANAAHWQLYPDRCCAINATTLNNSTTHDCCGQLLMIERCLSFWGN